MPILCISRRRWCRYAAFVAVAAISTTLLSACDVAAGVIASTTQPSAPLLPPAPSVQVGADTVSLLRSGAPTFHELRALIDTAHASVHVEVYEFGQTSLADALITAHRRGVAVTVIDDPSELHSAVITVRLREAGVDVADYPVRKLMIDHVKLLVVDRTVAVVGGINWGVNSPANRDYDAMVRGPVVGNLDRVFLRDLVTCGRAVAVPDPLLDPAILVASTLPATEIRPLALAVIESAHASLDLELFVLTDTGIVHALEAAQRRGVAIHVLLDPSQPSSSPLRQRQLVRWRLRQEPRGGHRDRRLPRRGRRDARPDGPRLARQRMTRKFDFQRITIYRDGTQQHAGHIRRNISRNPDM